MFLSLENLCNFLLAKIKTWKLIFNTNCESLQNCTEKQIMSSKTTINWLFNDIWCYLFIACFDWKIVFQQTVARVYYILKSFTLSVFLVKRKTLGICCLRAWLQAQVETFSQTKQAKQKVQNYRPGASVYVML